MFFRGQLLDADKFIFQTWPLNHVNKVCGSVTQITGQNFGQKYHNFHSFILIKKRYLKKI